MKFRNICILAIVGFIFIAFTRFNSPTVIRTILLENGRRIQIVRDDCQEGMPHTTDSITIRMTESAWESEQRMSILRHEHIHCDQKTALRKWNTFYKTVWNYECVASPPPGIPKEYIETLRPNPDTSDAPWAIWRNRWVFFPVAIGKRDGQLILRNAHVVVWDLKYGTVTAPPIEWRVEFCEGPGGTNCPRQFEHPHELAAEFLTDRLSKSPAAQKLFTWIAKSG